MTAAALVNAQQPCITCFFKTQAFKREMVTQADVDTGVTYVPADFEDEDWCRK